MVPENDDSPPAPISQPDLETWLSEAKQGVLSWAELAERLLSQADTGRDAHRPDADRARRCGFGEVVFGSGKTLESLISISERLLVAGQNEVLVTRLEPEVAEQVSVRFPHARYDADGRTLRVSRQPITPVNQAIRPHESGFKKGTDLPCPAPNVAVVTAGSTDFPVAREAVETLGWMGFESELITDVGVAGPYRLLAHLDRLRRCNVVVVIAGMEGALASVVGGLIACPVIAVPTSVGYGANFEGITTLLSMLSSCAAGVTAVNIDAGFKGGYIAGLIAAQVQAARTNHGD